MKYKSLKEKSFFANRAAIWFKIGKDGCEDKNFARVIQSSILPVGGTYEFPENDEVIPITPRYFKLKNKEAIVQDTWKYSYDSGGFPMVIPIEDFVTDDMVGKPAYKACLAWEYFLVPEFL